MLAQDEKVVRSYTVKEARDKFKDVVDNVVYTREPAIVTKHGKQKVAVVPYELLELFTRIEAIVDIEKARKAMDDYEKSGGSSFDELMKELGLK